MEPHSVNGTYTGTGSAISVNIGFRPSKIVIWNETDGDKRFEFIDGLASAKVYSINDSGSEATDLSVIATAGITLTERGFSVGTDATLNESAKVFRYHVSR